MTDSPPSGHRCELLTIETDDFELIIKGPIKNEIVEAFSLHQNERLIASFIATHILAPLIILPSH